MLSLPDEILMLIFQHLSTKEYISLSKVCSRFKSLLFDKSFSREICFSLKYNLLYEDMRDFTGTRKHYIESLNLNGCYWLSRKELISLIKPLVNLKELYFVNTNLGIQDFYNITNKMQLKKVSFYWPRWPLDQKNKKLILPKSPKQFDELESVTLIFQSHHEMPNQDIFNFVGSCRNLKKINLIQTSGNLDMVPELGPQLNLPTIYQVDLNDIGSESGINLDNSKDTEVITANGKTSILEIKNLNNLKHLLIFKDYFRNLAEFFSKPHPVLHLQTFLLNSNFFEDTISLNNAFGSIFKSLDKESLENLIICLNRFDTWYNAENIYLEDLTNSFPNVKHFELINSTFASVQDILYHLGKWNKLVSLALSNVTIMNINFLVEVSIKCTSLKYLSLVNLGLSAHFSHINLIVLCEALKNMKNLRDFRLEVSNIGHIELLFIALSQCPNIERVYLDIRSPPNNITSKVIIEFLKTNQNLVFFSLVYPHLAKDIKRDVTCFVNNLRKTRPAFVIYLVRTQDRYDTLDIHVGKHLYHFIEVRNRNSFMHFWRLFEDFDHLKSCHYHM